MEVICERQPFCAGRSCSLLLLNFHKLSSRPCMDEEGVRAGVCEFGWRELLCACAGLCSTSLPDMEESAVYSGLTAPGARVLLALESRRDVLQRREQSSACLHGPSQGAPRVGGGAGGTETSDEPRVCGGGEEKEGDKSVEGKEGERRGGVVEFCDLFSGSESEEEEDNEEEEEEGPFAAAQAQFLSQATVRRHHTPPTLNSTGPEHCLVGCAALLRLSIKPGSSCVQLSLLAVRGRARRGGMGRLLLRRWQDPALAGHYDALLAYVDSKALGFFARMGFVDDPIVTAKYRAAVEPWDNSTLMAYLPPFSSSVSAVGSVQSITNVEDHFEQWRSQAVSGYCEQLGFMQRLRHEALLLHSKVLSQEEVIAVLSRELQEARAETSRLEHDFEAYRKRTQRQLCETALARAEQWLAQAEASS